MMQATMWARPFFIAAPPNGCYPIIYCTTSMDQGAVGVVVVYVIFDTLLLLHFSDHHWMSSTVQVGRLWFAFYSPSNLLSIKRDGSMCKV